MYFKHLLLGTLTLIATTAFAAEHQRLNVEPGAHHPVLSPDGNTLLYSTVDHTGLKALNMTSGQVSVIDDGASAGFRPIFTIDGSQVIYRTASTIDGLLYRDVRSYNLRSRQSARIAEPSRDTTTPVALSGAPSFAVSKFSKIDVCINGSHSLISPVDDAHTYLWASLSPDGSALAFCEPFNGVFVSNPDGSNLRQLLPKGDYITWAGDNTIIAVVSHDDGYVILDSKLVKVNTATGIVTDLTDDSFIVSEATAAANGIVVFSDLDGNMFTLNINAQ